MSLVSQAGTGPILETSLSQEKGCFDYKSSCNWEPTFFSNYRKEVKLELYEKNKTTAMKILIFYLQQNLG